MWRKDIKERNMHEKCFKLIEDIVDTFVSIHLESVFSQIYRSLWFSIFTGWYVTYIFVMGYCMKNIYIYMERLVWEMM